MLMTLWIACAPETLILSSVWLSTPLLPRSPVSLPLEDCSLYAEARSFFFLPFLSFRSLSFVFPRPLFFSAVSFWTVFLSVLVFFSVCAHLLWRLLFTPGGVVLRKEPRMDVLPHGRSWWQTCRLAGNYQESWEKKENICVWAYRHIHIKSCPHIQ